MQCQQYRLSLGHVAMFYAKFTQCDRYDPRPGPGLRNCCCSCHRTSVGSRVLHMASIAVIVALLYRTGMHVSLMAAILACLGVCSFGNLESAALMGFWPGPQLSPASLSPPSSFACMVLFVYDNLPIHPEAAVDTDNVSKTAALCVQLVCRGGVRVCCYYAHPRIGVDLQSFLSPQAVHCN